MRITTGRLIPWVAIAALAACNDVTAPASLAGSYAVVASHQDGTVAFTGRLTLSVRNDTALTGTWADDHAVAGLIFGVARHDSVFVNLEPGVDTGLFLVAGRAGRRLVGRWHHVDAARGEGGVEFLLPYSYK